MVRRVDAAMAARRRQKDVIRGLWVEEVRRYEADLEDAPLYLTLPGGEGLDIQALFDAQVVKQTEVGGVAKAEQWKVVGVETSPGAVRELQAKIPGLKIIEGPIENLVAGHSQIRWPRGEHERFCRACVVNLDLNRTLQGVVRENGPIVFPVLEMVRKFARLHVEPARREWTLLLTLHGTIEWHDDVSRTVQAFLSENCEREPAFAEGLERLLGTAFRERLRDGELVRFSELGTEEQQFVLGVLVPKKVAELVQDQLWGVRTEYNIRYGGGVHAPMVSWILAFRAERQLGRSADRLYRSNLRNIYERVVKIDDSGAIQG